MKRYTWFSDSYSTDYGAAKPAASKDVNWMVCIHKGFTDISITEDPVTGEINIRGKGRDSLTQLIDYLRRVEKDIDAGYTGFVEE
jgi:hypothetical protein